jgi:hypothetical protein
MRVMTAHKILICTAAAFFVFYGGWEILHAARGGDAWGLARGLVALAAAAALWLYFAHLLRSHTIAGLADSLKKTRRTP